MTWPKHRSQDCITVRNATQEDVWPRATGGCPYPQDVADEIRAEALKVRDQDIPIGCNLPAWFAKFSIAEARVLKRKKVETQTNNQLADLRRRVDRLWQESGQVMPKIFATLERILDRIEHLEQNHLKFMGVHEIGRTYTRGSLVVRNGGLWHANVDTSAIPGKSADWQLAVKRGEVEKVTKQEEPAHAAG